ncbi:MULTISPECIES: acyl-CoA dehydrogenase family protein [Streptomyces]|uniref:Acyl-CoA dehydrogenase n=1 Tax=Streptomyces cinereoruber TaxID=67260 RepID=A0AAV4KGI8_9ACTN|nr:MULTISPECIES: acyl-CoA dehydrogenase [Streptomyces]AVH98910.1 acyl-CoA dehydrogenase [Streptomyces sp. WAC00288]KYG52194.1 acyl-CoA dehydrogenase [Streptomyces sp. WAC04657]MBB4160408.1 alkylation response protein AidB-like acyl-CoA dehydrogenase [Streptomyces cinereoruber]MBY8818952.1 acyl-CoA dehydrogenase [Streptomyces cinereoruber]NIH63073.1 alkylation response protein AidB-like acyl-CoA dehydrogenase [Streptomyces cinereoruber]
MSTPRKSPKRPAVRTASAPAGRAVDRPADDEIWPRVTRELADDLAVDALTRDRAGKAPFDEVARLQEAGLPALLTAPGPSRRGADWRAACAVVREISAADSSVGELLAHHYALSWSSRFFGPAHEAPAPRASSAPEAPGAARRPLALDVCTAEERWLLAGGVEPPRPATGPGLVLTPAEGSGGGWILDGRRAFASGVTVADRLVVGARPGGTGDLLVVLVDPAHPGVFTDAGTDRVGQRLAGAGTVTFDHVPVPSEHVLGVLPHDEHAVAPFTTLAPLALRLLLTQVGLGIAEGALAEARDISRADQAGPAPAGGADGPATADGTAPAGAGDDPYLLLAYGELATAAHAAAAVVERATDALARGLHAEWSLTPEERADISVLVAAAETVTGRAAVHITTRILELVDGTAGADSRAGGPGFDRFWRNARALTAPTRADHRLRDIGDHYLNGTHARLTLLA